MVHSYCRNSIDISGDLTKYVIHITAFIKHNKVIHIGKQEANKYLFDTVDVARVYL